MVAPASPPDDAGAPGERQPRSLSDKLGWLVLAALVLSADLWTKHVVFTPLSEHQYEWVFGEWFGFTKVWNEGMMWGLAQDWSLLLRGLRVLAAGIVFVMILGTPAKARLLQAALALVLGGALGNIYDGFVFGRVRDFLIVDLDVPVFDPFPIFNVADSAICVGVGLLALGLLLDGRRERAARASTG